MTTMELIEFFGLMAAAGAVAGIVSGLLGVGGGIILVPVFFYVFASLGYQIDQLMQICVATSTGTIIFTSLRSVLAHNKRGAVSFAVIKQWGPFVAVGAVFGVFAATAMRSVELQIVFGCIGIFNSLYMAFGRRDWKISDELPGRILGGIYGAIIGFLSSLIGIGGGSFTVPLLTLYGTPPHRAVGTSPGIGLFIAIPAFITFLLTGWDIADKPPLTVGYVNLPTVVLIVLTTTLTVPLGVKLAHKLTPGQLRVIFAITIFILAGNMLRKGLMG